MAGDANSPITTSSDYDEMLPKWDQVDTIEVLSGSTPLNPVVQWGPGLGDSIHVQGQNSTFGSYVQRPQAILYAEGKVQRLPPDKVVAQPVWQGDYPFAGIDDHYFIASLIRPGVTKYTFAPSSAPMPGQPAIQRDMVSVEMLFSAPPKDKKIFFGPKDFDVLQSVDRDLVRWRCLGDANGDGQDPVGVGRRHIVRLDAGRQGHGAVEGSVLEFGVCLVRLLFAAFGIDDQGVVVDGDLHVVVRVDPGKFGADHIVVVLHFVFDPDQVCSEHRSGRGQRRPSGFDPVEQVGDAVVLDGGSGHFWASRL